MSRYCADFDSNPILQAAEHWRAQALLKDGSAFGNKPLWSFKYLEELDKYYVNSPDESEGTFLEKLHEQLAPTTPETGKSGQ